MAIFLFDLSGRKSGNFRTRILFSQLLSYKFSRENHFSFFLSAKQKFSLYTNQKPKKKKKKMNNNNDQSNLTGLVLSNTENIRSFLSSASNDPNLSHDLQQTAISLSSLTNVPYKSIRSLWFASQPSTRPDLFGIFSGSDFIFSSPKPREKSEELKVRLKKLADLAERSAYAELVKDITPRKGTDEPFSSYKDQLGFGLHVVLIMFTGYLVGYAAFRALFGHSPVMNAAGGILGLVIGMLVETFLFIIRTSDQDLKSSTSTSKLKKNQ